ncbi:Csu type fimbrial protein [Alkalisalibacterium limincola]|uniref:Spore coat protein U domain-containing protein n=1 Tax=Alkalisalibacterium limincola TaxID=2699169 RepID=A0A5C8KQ00_9GAMM|nr:spore coat U domain-containing protein [Alkalisalibacterium limincola]TXK62339.1 spore coat protein U domain-containing protein [Alkalisalibacterium limincola]
MNALPRLAVLASSLLVAQAFAAGSPQSSNFDVTATVLGSCVITDTQNIDFGQYDPADANLTAHRDAEGSVTVRCVRGTAVTVSLGQGNNQADGSSCATPLRQMAAGTERLGYGLYQDATRNTPWGCDAANQQEFTAASPSTPTVLTTFGRIPGGQDVAAGSYTDRVTVDVTF